MPGLTLIKAQRLDEARSELENSDFGRRRKSGPGPQISGRHYWQKHEFQRAIDEFETYLRLMPNAPER